MKIIRIIGIVLAFATTLYAQSPDVFIQQLPVYAMQKTATTDWLLNNEGYEAAIYVSADKKSIVMANGLVERIFTVSPDVACISYKNLSSGLQMLRAVSPETFVTIDLIEYPVGGLNGQLERGYLKPEWINTMTSPDNDFKLSDIKVSDIHPYVNWTPKRWCSNPNHPKGKTLDFFYTSTKTPRLKGLTIIVRYELYDGIPLMNKWVEVRNNTPSPVVVNKVVNETLALVEEESSVVGSLDDMLKPQYLYVETNYAFNNAMNYRISDQTTHWKRDYKYTSQVNYHYGTPCILEIYPNDPNMRLETGQFFRSPHSFELLIDSYDRERSGLAVRRMYPVVAPWTTENPIFMHLVSRTDDQVYTAIDQCIATGYEALILSFGSHINVEDISPENVAKMKQMADYAHRNNILIGCYSLFSSRSIGPETDVINPRTGKPGDTAYGQAPCLGSEWGLNYIKNLKYMFTETGFDIFENDGPYPGDVCASTSHPGHEGLHDSQWRQMEMQKEFYRWCNEHNVYVNAPDWYFLDGTHKIGMGYREVNFALPRDRQRILNRQNIFDAAWLKIPSMGWGFVPLTAYHNGGPDAVLEPLSEHLDDYEQLMMQYYGAGIQACYRGPRLYDTDETKAVVQRVITWYKKYRDILNSDVIHLRRADGREWDGIMHVNPRLKEKALAMLYNPLDTDITRTIKLPVYYTARHDRLSVRIQEGKPKNYQVDRDYNVTVTVTIPANSYTWLVME